MCRLVGWVSRPGLTLRSVLGEESFAAFAQLSRIHADGWGIAYASDGEVAIEKSTTCAFTDPAFHTVASDVATEAGIAHLRWATPGLPVELSNTHPFRHGQTAFAHNGAIHPLDQISQLLPASWHARLSGTTDSEHYFLALMAEVDDDGADIPTAVARVADRVARTYAANSLNAMLLTSTALYVVNCHDPSVQPSLPTLSAPTVEGLVAAIEEDAPYFDLRYRRTRSAVVVASSGFAQPEGGGWRPLANNSMLIVNRETLTVQEIALDAHLDSATTTTSVAERPV
jgi:predicted glutamine amidotransferase